MQASPPAAPDRSVRLIVFGALSALVGLGLLFLAGFYVIVPFTGLLPQEQLPWQSIAMGAITYALLGGAFVWVGLGSIRKRRWTRSVMLVLSWSWLLTGVLLFALFLFMLDGLFASSGSPGTDLSPDVLALAKTLVLAVLGIGGILLPAAFVVVYRDPALQATCEQASPELSFVDHCPTTVLGLSLGLAAAAVLSIPMALHPVVPVFGRIVGGPPGAVLTLLLAVICAAIAYSTFKMEARGWWGALVLMVLLGVSTGVTFLIGDPEELFAALAQSGGRELGIADSGPLLVWATVLFTLASVLYMLKIRRHFFPESPGRSNGRPSDNG